MPYTRKQVHRIVQDALDLWRPITGTDRWTIAVKWDDGDNELDGRSAGISASPEYLHADLRINVSRIVEAEPSEDSISYDILHELSHCLVWVLFAMAQRKVVEQEVSDANELTTTRVARAIWVAYYDQEPPDD